MVKVFLGTKGFLKDVDEELEEFLGYIEDSSDEFASKAKSNLVKQIHHKVDEVKNDQRLEVEFMTLLERDREKIQEGIEKGIEQGIEQGREEEKRELARNFLKLGVDAEVVVKAT